MATIEPVPLKLPDGGAVYLNPTQVLSVLVEANQTVVYLGGGNAVMWYVAEPLDAVLRKLTGKGVDDPEYSMSFVG